MAEPNYTKDEREILRQSRVFQDMLATEGWKELERILSVQIRSREEIINAPMYLMKQEFQALDLQSKAAAIESVKGEKIGLRLALTTPSATIAHATEIVREHQGDGR